MRKIIYSKYNQNRTPRYQTKTLICKEGDYCYVEKSAVNEQGIQHIRKFAENYDMVKDLYPGITLIPVQSGENYVRYPYIDGVAIEKEITRVAVSPDALIDALKQKAEEIYKVNSDFISQFEFSDEYTEIFGNVDCSDMVCVRPCNLDVIFDNLIRLPDGSIAGFDYEWVFDIALPVKYAVYRVFRHYYDKYENYIRPYYTYGEYNNRLGLSYKEQEIFGRLEQSLITYIQKDGEPAFLADQYSIKRIPYAEMDIKVKEFDGVKGMLDLVVNSKSWKVTKPARWIKGGAQSVRNNGIKETVKLVKNKLGRTQEDEDNEK